MLARWQPFGDARTEMARLHEEMNRLFDRWGSSSRVSRNVFPLLNLWEDESSLHVEAELPGLELNDLEIFVTGENQLSIKGQRKSPEPEKGTWHRQERGHGAFSRSLELPSLVDNDKVTAELKQGVLTINLPKRQQAKPRRIEVKCD